MKKQILSVCLLLFSVLLMVSTIGCSEAVKVVTTTTTTTTSTSSTTTSSTTTTSTTLPAAATPTFLGTGYFQGKSRTVSMECSTSGATIYYTVDGSIPTTSSAVYSIPFTIYTSTRIKAIAAKSGYSNSDVATEDFDLYWWSSLEGGVLDGGVNALACIGSDVYVGGNFDNAGTTTVNKIAKWNSASGWSDLDSGVDNDVYTLATDGTNLYIGGSFSTAGSGATTVSNIAKWNGSSWSSLGGTDGYVFALAYDNNSLYAGGSFANANTLNTPVLVNFVAKLNGSSWSAFDAGVNNEVNALAVSGNNVYVGGKFITSASGVSTPRLARWTGSTWEALGLGTESNKDVHALAVLGGDVYAGGSFTTAGGGSAPYIAKWNGSSWSSVDTGMNQAVRCLVVFNNILQVGGDFTTAGVNSVNRYTRWNGSSWAGWANGTGADDCGINAIAFDSSGNMYIGGSFNSVDGNSNIKRVARFGKI